jgi:peptidoglycan/LPS O-acetylase OafA/YrhL
MSTIPTAGNSVENGFPLNTWNSRSSLQSPTHAKTSSAKTSRVAFGERLASLDAAKGIAALLIVMHHATFYGRPADLAMEVAPSVVNFFYVEARLVVQLFLVLGGFGLAWTHSSGYITWSKSFQDFAKRYLRLLIPFATVLGFLLVVTRLIGAMEPGNPIVESISLPQFLSHLFFLQGLLGYENLTAGAWYLCIDIQFAATFLLIGAIVSQIHRKWSSTASSANDMAIVLSLLGIVSAWYWNRFSSLDNSVFYFFTPFVLGALIAWERKNNISPAMLLCYAIAIMSALAVEYRARLVVALVCGGLLWSALKYGSKLSVPVAFVWLGRISYSLFVSHYLVLILTMAALDAWMADSPYRALAVLLASISTSLMVASCLYYCVELPFQTWLKRATRSLLDQQLDAALANR